MDDAGHPPAVTVRPRQDGDMVTITRIYAHHVMNGTSSWELTPPDSGEMTRRAEALERAGYPYLVAEADGEVIGYAYAGAYRPRPAYRFTVENSVYVDDVRRRHGTGRALMQALIEACTTRGFRQMIAIVGDSANLQSIDFHEKLGFQHVGVIANAGYKFERWMDQVVLQMPLGEGADTPPDDI